MHKVVLAPDSFKGTLTSIEVCDLVETAFRELSPDTRVVKVPIADGGEGTVDAYLAALGGRHVAVDVLDPLFRPIRAVYGILPDGRTAVVEMAAASGLPLVGDRKDPLHATSVGTGQLIRDALDRGCTTILLGLGGSATNDGGVGLASALGVRFFDERGDAIEPTGGGLAQLRRIDRSALDPRLAACGLLVACDVDNPLCGPQGASAVFGPQKGATADMVGILDHNLARYADLLLRDCGADVREIPGSGAAGGLAASLLAFVPRCTLVPGIRLLLDAVGFDARLQDADLVITGEGKMDGQSVHGKAPVGVAERAMRADVPCIAIVGTVGEGWEAVRAHGIQAVYRTSREGATFEEIRRTCREDLVEAARKVVRSLVQGTGGPS
jgi:glycerate 2-kinase